MTTALPTQQRSDGEVTTDLYAWIAQDSHGVEGIIMAPDLTGTAIPLVCGTREGADSLCLHAYRVANSRGTTASLVRFERAEVVREIQP